MIFKGISSSLFFACCCNSVRLLNENHPATDSALVRCPVIPQYSFVRALWCEVIISAAFQCSSADVASPFCMYMYSNIVPMYC